MAHRRGLALAASLSFGCMWQLDPPLRAPPDGAVVDVPGPDVAPDVPPTRCSPVGASRTCYSAPRATQGIGACRGGMQTCLPSGVWGPCAGEVTPTEEDCNNLDDNCNGMVDDVSPRPCGGAAAGYRLSSSPQPWIEACTQPGNMVLFVNVDDGASSVPIGFSFEFFGNPQTSAEVSTNGVLGVPFGIHDYRNAPLPGPATAGMILPFWDDLFTRTGVCVATVGADGARQFVAEWSDAFFYNNRNTATHITFEVILSERGNLIDVLYQRMEGEGERATGISATIGLQDPAGILFDQLGFNTPNVVRTGFSMRWTPASTSGVGQCRAATQTCRAGMWSSCASTAMPSVETCDGVDNDCDGAVDDGIFRSCYTGPPNTQELGICRQGASVCTAGGVFSPCRGEVLPMPVDICTTPFDENCDNTINDHCM